METGGGLDRRSPPVVAVFDRLSHAPPSERSLMFLEAAGLSTFVVAASEMGDKTQLLALLLAARFRAPLPIILGILAATIFNHALAGIFGAALAAWINPLYLKWALTISFLAMAAWMLIPDKGDDVKTEGRFGAFGTTLVLFFLAEMGDAARNRGARRALSGGAFCRDRHDARHADRGRACGFRGRVDHEARFAQNHAARFLRNLPRARSACLLCAG